MSHLPSTSETSIVQRHIDAATRPAPTGHAPGERHFHGPVGSRDVAGIRALETLWPSFP